MKLRIQRTLKAVLMMMCLISLSLLSPETVSAKKITSINQAEQKALKKVKGATVTEIDKDYDDGVLVYEVHLIKGTKEYDITYRASDGKTLSYGWEENAVNRTSKKKIMSKASCKKLAKKKVKNAKITSIVKKTDDGVVVYKLKMKTKSKKYELVYHARTRKLLEYDWELITKTSDKTSRDKYIGVKKVKEIALKKVPNADVVKVEFDMDDGVPVYEVELIKGRYEYDLKIHAKTGKILEYEEDLLD